MSPPTCAGCEAYYKQYVLSTRHGTLSEVSEPKSLSVDTDLTLGGSLLPIESRNGARDSDLEDTLVTDEDSDQEDIDGDLSC